MRASAEMIFYADEIEELFEVLETGYQSNGNIVNLGLICNFDLGLRGGELCALKWLDINWIKDVYKRQIWRYVILLKINNQFSRL